MKSLRVLYWKAVWGIYRPHGFDFPMICTPLGWSLMVPFSSSALGFWLLGSFALVLVSRDKKLAEVSVGRIKESKWQNQHHTIKMQSLSLLYVYHVQVALRQCNSFAILIASSDFAHKSEYFVRFFRRQTSFLFFKLLFSYLLLGRNAHDQHSQIKPHYSTFVIILSVE